MTDIHRHANRLDGGRTSHPGRRRFEHAAERRLNRMFVPYAADDREEVAALREARVAWHGRRWRGTSTRPRSAGARGAGPHPVDVAWKWPRRKRDFAVVGLRLGFHDEVVCPEPLSSRSR